MASMKTVKKHITNIKTVKDNFECANYQIIYSYYERLKGNPNQLILGNVKAIFNLIIAKIRTGLRDENSKKPYNERKA